MRALLGLMVLVFVPLGAAQIDTGLDDERCSFAPAENEPPCGYILPQLDIVIDGKLACGGGYIIYAEGPPEDCYEMLDDGETHVYSGVVRWFWELSEDGTYPKEAGTDILLTFGGTATNPSYITATVEGEDMVDGAFVIDDVQLAHPDNLRQMQNAQGNDAVYFWYEKPITITFTRDGGPDQDGLEWIADRDGIRNYFIKAKSTESGARFKEAFGVEEFRYNACTDDGIASEVVACGGLGALDDSRDTPGLPVAVLLGALALAARRKL